MLAGGLDLNNINLGYANLSIVSINMRLDFELELPNLWFDLCHSPTQFEVNPEIPKCHDRDRTQFSHIGI